MKGRKRFCVISAILFLILLGASYRTQNFVVETADANQAEQFAIAAEKYRHDLAVEWLGQAMPKWSKPCGINVQIAKSLGSGGNTSFIFDRGEVYGWTMIIYGSPERLLDSVLPHEITHMVLASHFRRPIPRWADEGCASFAECKDERSKRLIALKNRLETTGGMVLPEMVSYTERYPQDVTLFYSQSDSLATFLIQQRGKRYFVNYIEKSIKDGGWENNLKMYGYNGYADFQEAWLKWLYPERYPKEIRRY